MDGLDQNPQPDLANIFRRGFEPVFMEKAYPLGSKPHH
jgi:hypothetical protein